MLTGHHNLVCMLYCVVLVQTLAYQSGMFSKAQALRRDGCAPAAMGVPDDLPTRMAYQQLHVLAGMAGKVRHSNRNTSEGCCKSTCISGSRGGPVAHFIS
jgi:hypothetical protein